MYPIRTFILFFCF